MSADQFGFENAALAFGFEGRALARRNRQYDANPPRPFHHVRVRHHVAARIDNDAGTDRTLSRDEGGLGSGIVFHWAVTGYQDLHHALRHLVGQANQRAVQLNKRTPASASASASRRDSRRERSPVKPASRSRSCASHVANKRVAIRNRGDGMQLTDSLRLSLLRMMFSFTSPLKVRLGLKTYCARSLRCSGNRRGTRFSDGGHRVTCCRGT